MLMLVVVMPVVICHRRHIVCKFSTAEDGEQNCGCIFLFCQLRLYFWHCKQTHMRQFLLTIFQTIYSEIP